MSNTSASSPSSIAAVGSRVSPYSEWIGSPVSSSRPLDTRSPGRAVPRIPCSGLNSATSSTRGCSCSRSMVLRPCASRPVWLVMRPTRLPSSTLAPWSIRTSIPSRTACAGSTPARSPATAPASVPASLLHAAAAHTATTSARRCAVSRQSLAFPIPDRSCHRVPTPASPGRGPGPPSTVMTESLGRNPVNDMTHRFLALISLIALAACAPFRTETPSPDASADAWVEQQLQRLTLRQKVGQMVMPWLGGEYLARNSDAYDSLRQWVVDYGVGGIIISIGAPLEVAAKLNMLQEQADLPLLIAADMENGPGMRLNGGVVLPYGMVLGGGTQFPPLMALG